MRKVEIIGGGLAGLGLGIALRRHSVPVTIHEAGRYPRHRVCGEFITSLDKHTRETLQLEKAFSRARIAQSVVWCEDGKPDMTHELPQVALCLSRYELDIVMAEKFVSIGGELRTGSREACTDEPGRIHACGRKPTPASPWVGIKQHFRGLDTHKDLEVHFGRGGYIGLTRVEGDTVNVCGLLKRGSADLNNSFAAIAAQSGFKKLAERLAGADAVADSFCAVAGLDYSAAKKDTSLRIGDRSTLIPPFTGNGMTIALQGAVAASVPLTAWSRDEIDWPKACAAILKVQKTHFAKRLYIARTLHPLVLSAPARSFARALHNFRVLPVGLLYRLMH